MIPPISVMAALKQVSRCPAAAPGPDRAATLNHGIERRTEPSRMEGKGAGGSANALHLNDLPTPMAPTQPARTVFKAGSPAALRNTWFCGNVVRPQITEPW